MSTLPDTPAAPAESTLDRLRETQLAFDSVAADYDGPRGNNGLIQQMRAEMWRRLDDTFPRASQLIDLGCGTGLDAVRMARRGHYVTAIDWSPRMVQRTRERSEREQVADRVQALQMGGQELNRLEPDASFDGVYSNLGPLNCVPRLEEVSRECARLLKPRGKLVFTVIGRYCPWELGHYLRRGRWGRATIRFARETVAVGMNHHTIWTRYYTPRELYRSFEQDFELDSYRGLCVFAPPPYMTWVIERHPRLHAGLWKLDELTAGWPWVRSMGDHFLIIMTRR